MQISLLRLRFRAHPMAGLPAREDLLSRLRGGSLVHVGVAAAAAAHHRRRGLLPLDALLRHSCAEASGQSAAAEEHPRQRRMHGTSGEKNAKPGE